MSSSRHNAGSRSTRSRTHEADGASRGTLRSNSGAATTRALEKPALLKQPNAKRSRKNTAEEMEEHIAAQVLANTCGSRSGRSRAHSGGGGSTPGGGISTPLPGTVPATPAVPQRDRNISQFSFDLNNFQALPGDNGGTNDLLPEYMMDDNLQLQDLLNLILDGQADGRIAQALIEPDLDNQSYTAAYQDHVGYTPLTISAGGGGAAQSGQGGAVTPRAGMAPEQWAAQQQQQQQHLQQQHLQQQQQQQPAGVPPLDVFNHTSSTMAQRVTQMKSEVIRFFHALAARLRSVPQAKDLLQQLQVDAGTFWQKILPRMINKPISFEASIESEKFRLMTLAQTFKDLDLPTCICTHYGHVASANVAFCELVGRTRDDLGERNKFRLFDFVHDDNIVEWIRHQIRSVTAVQGSKQSYRMACKVVNKCADDGFVPCILTATLIRSLQFGDYCGSVFIFTPTVDSW